MQLLVYLQNGDLFLNFSTETATFILEYDYAHNKRCSGQPFHSFYKTSLHEVLDSCKNDDSMGKCSCIEDDGCDGYYWTLYTGQPITSNSSCTWTRGNLIVKVEYKYYSLQLNPI